MPKDFDSLSLDHRKYLSGVCRDGSPATSEPFVAKEQSASWPGEVLNFGYHGKNNISTTPLKINMGHNHGVSHPR